MIEQNTQIEREKQYERNKEPNGPSPISEREMRRIFDDAVLERGRAYFREGRVTNAIVEGSELLAECSGSLPENYRVRIVLDDGIDFSCSCPYQRGPCKHVAAVLYAYLIKPEGFRTVNRLRAHLERKDRIELVNIIIDLVRGKDGVAQMLIEGANAQTSGALANSDPESVSREEQEKTTNSSEEYFRMGIEASFAQFYDEEGNVKKKVAPHEIDILADKLEHYASDARALLDKNEYQSALAASSAIIECMITRMGDVPDRKGVLKRIPPKVLETFRQASERVYTGATRAQYYKKCIEYYLNDESFIEELKALIFEGASESDLHTIEGIVTTVISRLGEFIATGKPAEFSKFRFPASRRHRMVDLLIAVKERLRDTNGILETLYEESLKNDGVTYAHRLISTYGRLGMTKEAIAYCEGYLENRSGENLYIIQNLARLYEEAGLDDRALEMYIRYFKIGGDSSKYFKIKKLAGARWNEIKHDIIRHLEARNARSTLAELYLRERELDEAIRIGNTLSNVALVENIADRSAFSRAKESSALYKRLVEYYIHIGGKQSYKKAAEICAKMRKSMERAQLHDEYEKYVDELKFVHRRKRAMLAEFASVGV